MNSTFCTFERNAIIAAHYKSAEQYDQIANKCREEVQKRGLLWQRYLIKALRNESIARKHRARASAIAGKKK